jgi:glucose/arabinose dehydrogenase
MKMFGAALILTSGVAFPADGERWATGIRDIGSLDWSPADGHLYGIMHARDNTHRFWPDLVSADDDDHIADEMHRITKVTDFGWPYTYFDGVRHLRLISPEYGGDGKQTAPSGKYSSPALTFHSRRAAPVDLLLYSGSVFPRTYRGGAFIVLHGTQNRNGYNVVFVPFDRNGKAGAPTIFADGFAGFDRTSPSRTPAVYRPIGIAEGPGWSTVRRRLAKGPHLADRVSGRRFAPDRLSQTIYARGSRRGLRAIWSCRHHWCVHFGRCQVLPELLQALVGAKQRAEHR